MNKRILSILLCLALVASLLVLAVPVNAAPANTQLIVTADKTEAKPGDVISFTVTLGPVSELGSLQYCLDIPEGLTYVPKSGKIADGAMEKMEYNSLDWTEITLMVNGTHAEADYECDEDTVLSVFQCTVDDDFIGTASVGLTRLEMMSTQTWEFHTDEYVVVPAEITVADETPTEPETEAPVTEAPATEEPATDAPVTEAPTEDPAPELVYVPQVDPTATEPGQKAHYVDPATGKKYADATGMVEVADDDLYIAPLGEPTEAPATEAPATEAPATEAPATEAPATEAPATEAPATEAPATEAPATEAPATEAPATEAPATEAPTTENPGSPVVDEPTEAPVVDKPTEVATKDSATKDSATKDSIPATPSASTPKTGDGTHMYLWMLITLASLAGAAAVLYTAKRKGIFTK